MARALHEEGEKDGLVSVVADLSMVHKNAFWAVLEQSSMGLYLRRQGRAPRLPRSAQNGGGLKDDAFRSLAGELRRLRGFAKVTTPFSEFL